MTKILLKKPAKSTNVAHAFCFFAMFMLILFSGNGLAQELTKQEKKEKRKAKKQEKIDLRKYFQIKRPGMTLALQLKGRAGKNDIPYGEMAQAG
jgi:uncharacterized membrane protein